MEEQIHGHVLTICRHCGNPANKFVGETMDAARENLRGLPAFFRSDDQLKYADIQIIDEDLIRIKLNKHDLLVFTSECSAPFEECFADYQQALVMADLERKFNQAMRTLLGSDFDPQKMLDEIVNGQPPIKQEPKFSNPKDRSHDILNQINLPEDFFGQQGH